LLAEAQCSATVVLADDNWAMVVVVAQFLEDEHYHVVAAVPDGMQLVNEVLAAGPDVAVVDIFMPVMNGLDAVAQLKRMRCETKCIILTASHEPEFVQAAFTAGACGYVLKNRLATDLPSAIESALRGEQFLSPSVTSPSG
jgi:DNA-binding NarL/FixJ family response regulator